MPGESPKLGGYQIKNPPNPIEASWEMKRQLHELADGSFRQRFIGFRFKASMTWEDGWIRREDLTGLIGVANDPSASITFQPKPITNTGLTYPVIWINKFDFVYHNGNYNTYKGTIDLVSPSTTSIAGDLP